MPRTVTLTKPIINQITINPAAGGDGNMTVTYTLTDDTGTVSQSDTIIFWRTMPNPGTNLDGTPAPIPSNWVQLPPVAKQNIIDIVQYVSSRVAGLLSAPAQMKPPANAKKPAKK